MKLARAETHVTNVTRSFPTVTLAKLNSDVRVDHVARRKAEGAGNRTINIEVGSCAEF